MQISIPKELIEYVRMSKKEGLIHRPDMPNELLPLFEKTKALISSKQADEQAYLKSLLIKEDK